MTKTANIHAAKTQLSKLIEAALEGEEVIIQKAGKPAVRLTPIISEAKRREPGSWRGMVRMSPDFDDMPRANGE